MSKGKIEKKWSKKEEKAVIPAFRTAGNLIDGYIVLNRDNEEVSERFENVRDAVAVRDRLFNEGS